MPLAASGNHRDAPIALTSKPRAPLSARPGSEGTTTIISKRRWNAPPADLFPAPAATSRVESKRTELAATTATPDFETLRNPREQFRAAIGTAAAATSRNGGNNASNRSSFRSFEAKQVSVVKTTAPTEQKFVAAKPPSSRRQSKVTQAQLHSSSYHQSGAPADSNHKRNERRHDAPGATSLRTDPKRQQLIAREAELSSIQDNRRHNSPRSTQVLRSLRRQDVEADDVTPLIEIIYWSPFVEVRRDAAAAIASLSRNAANLDLLDEVGALGAILTMLTSSVDREDSEISHDCAHALAALVRLPTVKSKLLQAPGGIDCVFSLLNTRTDQKLRLVGFEIVVQLVTTDEWRDAVAKREGFSFMLNHCSGSAAPQNSKRGAGDTRTRTLAASVLHHLAASCDNRVLFYHSGYFTTLACLLRDPFLDKDTTFRRELLSFVHLLLSEAENSRRFAALGLVPCILGVLGRNSSCAARPSLQVTLLVVAILDAVAKDIVNHEALVNAEAVPRLVQLCFYPASDLPTVNPHSKRPQTASIAQNRAPPSRPASAASSRPRSRSASMWSASESTAVVRAVLGIICAMAQNFANRKHIIRSKVLDHIAARELYASPDKRIRRAVITLLTSLICTKRKRSQAPSEMTNAESTTVAAWESHGTSERDYQHYIELLARGVVKCLFGILAGDDFGMKVDALGALAQLTDDPPSRLTLCKPALLSALGQFAFHPLASTRLHVAQIIANFAERPENVLKLVDAGLLPVLVRYVSPAGRSSHSSDKVAGDSLLVEATRALAAVSELHVARTKLAESGVVGILVRLIRAQSNRAEVRSYAQAAVRNLRHDAAALRIQAIYRGWHVRTHFGPRRKQNIRKLSMLVDAASASSAKSLVKQR